MSYCYSSDGSIICAPPKMADGRCITDYRSSSLIDVHMTSKLKTPNQYEYRQYLMRNGAKIARLQRQKQEATLYINEKNAPKLSPERYMTVCQNNKCKIVQVNPNGIGTGRMPTGTWSPIVPTKQNIKNFDSTKHC